VDERAVTCARKRSPVVETCEPESSNGTGIAHREVEVPGRHIKAAHSERSAAEQPPLHFGIFKSGEELLQSQLPTNRTHAGVLQFVPVVVDQTTPRPSLTG
jgi:hypothetical protein